MCMGAGGGWSAHLGLSDQHPPTLRKTLYIKNVPWRKPIMHRNAQLAIFSRALVSFGYGFVNYPVLTDGASRFIAPPCPLTAGRGRSSTGSRGGSHPDPLRILRDAL